MLLTHPRTWLTPSVLARARARVAAGHPLWRSLKARVDVPGSWETGQISYCVAWQLTGNAAYADSAIKLAMIDVAEDMDRVTSDDGYYVREIVRDLAVVYDFCQGRLTDSQKTDLRAWLESACKLVWPETGGHLATDWGGWPSSNYWHGYQMTWLAGIALHGDSPLGQALLDQAVARHRARVMGRMSAEWSGAYPEEGTGYGMSGSWMWMAHQLGAHLTATGDASATILPASWYPSLLRAFIHLTAPDLAHLYPGGDQALNSSAPITDYSLAAVLQAMDTLSTEDAGMARYWLDQVYPTRPVSGAVAWMPLLWYRDDVPPADYRAKLPTHYSMPGVGVMSTRSSWAPDAVQLVCVGGPVRDNDHDDDTGSFFIRRGADVLAGMQKIWGPSGLEHKAAALNTVLIGGRSQPGKQEDTHVLFSTDSPAATSWAADLTGAYPDELDEWRREVLFVRPHWVVIYDRVRTKNAATEKKWLLHTKNAPVLSGNRFRATAGGSNLFGTVLLPVGAAPAQESLGTSYRLNVRDAGATLTRFLTVLEAAPASQTAPSPVEAAGVIGSSVTLSLAGIAVQCTLNAEDGPALSLTGEPPPPPPPPGDLTVALTAASMPTGAVFAGTVKDSAPLPAGSTITVTARTPDNRTAQAVATIAGAPPPPPPPTALFADAFDGSVVGDAWVGGVLVSGGAAGRDPKVLVAVGGGALTITPRSATGQHYNGILTRAPYNLTGAAATVEVLEATKGSANTQFGLVLDGKNFYLMETEGGRLYCAAVMAGIRSDRSVAYSAAAHRFWRIRHEIVDQIIWETSADGVTWAAQRSMVRLLPVAALVVELAAGSWELVATPGKAVFGGVRVERVG